jgi:hypothetical protein
MEDRSCALASVGRQEEYRPWSPIARFTRVPLSEDRVDLIVRVLAGLPRLSVLGDTEVVCLERDQPASRERR